MSERIIKFRVWDQKLEKYVLPSEESIKDTIFYLGGSPQSSTNSNNYIFQQFTGLYDKSGKEIYEGDIIKSSAEQMCKNNAPISYKDDYYALVNYNRPCFILTQINQRFSHIYIPVFWNGCEVIGNIFENPKILKCKIIRKSLLI